MSLGSRIRMLRLKNSLSQQELAEAIKSAGSTISEVERGVRMPRTTLVKKIATHFGVTTDYLLNAGPDDSTEITELKARLEKVENELDAARGRPLGFHDFGKSFPPDIVAECPLEIDPITRTKLELAFAVKIRSTLLDEESTNSIFRFLWVLDKTKKRIRGLL